MLRPERLAGGLTLATGWPLPGQSVRPSATGSQSMSKFGSSKLFVDLRVGVKRPSCGELPLDLDK